MIIIKRDVTDPSEKEIARFSHWQPTTDGMVVATNVDGTFLYQEPEAYGLLRVTPNPNGPYQNARLNGQLVSYWTRPQDTPYVYSWAQLPN